MERPYARPGLLGAVRDGAACGFDDVEEDVSTLIQAAQIAPGNGLQNLCAARTQVEQHPAPIGFGISTRNKVSFDQAGDQFYGAMVFDQQTVS